MITEKDMKTKKNALAFFKCTPEKWNCAQAVLKSHQERLNLTDEEIELKYRPMGGGHAEGGLCGALYSSLQAVGPESEAGKRILKGFQEKLGAITCHDLKQEKRIPCSETVALADELLGKELY